MTDKPLEAGLRVAIAIIVLALLAGGIGNAIAAALAPVFGRTIEVLVPQISILAIDVANAGTDSVIQADAAPKPVVLVAGRLLPLSPMSRFHVSTLAGHVLLPNILLLAVLIAWPAGSVRQYALRAAAALPTLLTLAMLDVPLVLAAEFESTLLELAGSQSFSMLAAWSAFLEGGGRLAIPLAAAAVLVSLTGTASRPIAPQGRGQA